MRSVQRLPTLVAGNRELQLLLPPLGRLPEIVRDDPELRHRLPLPLRGRVSIGTGTGPLIGVQKGPL